MDHGGHTTHVAFRVVEPSPHELAPVRLRVDIVIDDRDHHATSRAAATPPGPIEIVGQAHLRVEHREGFALHLRAWGGALHPDPEWYRDFSLSREAERGLPAREDHARAARAELAATGDDWCGLTLTTDPAPATSLTLSLTRARDRERALLERAQAACPCLVSAPEWVSRLVLAADSFLIRRPLADGETGASVIAGYPWFGDWGRDTMIALPGLALSTGRADEALEVLETYAGYVDAGMLPNVFPGSGGIPHYNTVDAALWYVAAWGAYFDRTGDREALSRAMPVLDAIVRAYRDGTRYGIGVDPADGLLRAGEAGVQLTWMDAKVGDWVVTPRTGKPVEVSALWYNAVQTLAGLAPEVGADATAYRDLTRTARAGFRRFLRADGEGLYDVLDGPEGNDAQVRPNQIFAVSLPHSPLDAASRAAVVSECRRHLLCSYGLRSLSPGAPEYRGAYAGGVAERDGAYHQGPVWAWLLGPYALAEFRVHGDAARAQRLLEPLGDHLRDAGLGTVSEIFDGDPPHVARGAPAQAWSVACTLEAWERLERARRAETEHESAH
jgi:4-alpha-glucanotransferase